MDLASPIVSPNASINHHTHSVDIPTPIAEGGDLSTQGSFLVDTNGSLVVDYEGNPVRRVRWKAYGKGQKERYEKMEQAARGPKPSARWVQNKNYSPDRMRVPKSDYEWMPKNGFRGRGIGKAKNGGILEALRQQMWARGVQAQVEAARGTGGSKSPKRRALAQSNTPKAQVMDGFALLAGSGMDLPDYSRRSDVSGGDYTVVVHEDMVHFPRLQVLDAGGNNLDFDSFVGLTQLRELRMPCNGLVRLEFRSGSYINLEFVDLSYNALNAQALVPLVQLPHLRSLDLTCNGLSNLPSQFTKLVNLEKLCLQRNQFEDADVLALLSTMPALRELDMAFNYLVAFTLPPPQHHRKSVTDTSSTPSDTIPQFPVLDMLDLAFNYIESEDDLLPLIKLPKLACVIVYGNPLCGTRGEDPLGVCVERLLSESDASRLGWVTPALEVVTEIPRPPGERARLPQSRRRPYSDMPLMLVREGSVPSTGAFKAEGNKIVFQFERPKESSAGELAMMAAATKHAVEMHRSAQARQRQEDLTFLTGVDTDNDVMYDGTNENRTVGTVPSSIISKEKSNAAELGLAVQALMRRPVDMQPKGDPAKLRAAIAALRVALRRPLEELPPKGTITVNRPNAAYKARELPRRPYELLRLREGGGMGRAGGGKGSLESVEHALDAMNEDLELMGMETRIIATAQGQRGGAGLSNLARMVNDVLDEMEVKPH